MNYIENWCKEQEVVFAINNGFTEGGKGAAAVAEAVVKLIETNPSTPINYCYDLTDALDQKIEKIAKRVYQADGIEMGASAKTKMKSYEKNGWGNLPVCIAKTQYSFTDDAKKINAPTGFTLHIRDLVINAGAGFIVAVAGDIMRMPGLPVDPQANRIKMVDGEIDGLS